jgi:type VI protein secretion system component VasF
MKDDEKIRALIKAAHTDPEVSAAFEHRIVLAVARRAIERAQQKARRNLVMSLSGLTVAAAACVAAVVLWFPTQILLQVDVNTIVDNILAQIRALI